MAGPADLTRDVDIDIAGLLREVWKRMWLVLALPLLAGVALFVLLNSMDPSYRSSARVIIEKRESVFTRRTDGDLAQSGTQFDEQAVGSQVEILTSADLALKVIQRLNLTEHKEFEEKPSMLADLLALGGGGRASGALTAEERILNDFTKRLAVYAVEKSRVIAIEFWAHDRELAQAVPNALADEYLSLTKAAQLETTEEATGWLGKEIEELRSKVRASEAKVAEYRASSDILVGNNNALLATQQLSETSSELSRVRAERSAAEGKAAAIRAALEQGASVETLPEVIASSLIQRLREREAALQAEISELETTLLPNHPRLKALKSQIADYQTQIRSTARNILQSLESNVDLLRRQEAVLLNEVNRLKAEAGRVGEAEVELRALEREAAAQRELLETYLARFREAASRQDREYLPVDARIISRAVTPAESFFPKVLPFTIAGIVGAMVLVIAAILAWALLAGKAFKEVGHPGFVPLPERAYDEAPVRLDAAVREEEEPLPVRKAPANAAQFFAIHDEAELPSETISPRPEWKAAAPAPVPAQPAAPVARSWPAQEPELPSVPSAAEIDAARFALPSTNDVKGWREITRNIDVDAAEYATNLSAALDAASVRPALNGANVTQVGKAPPMYGAPGAFEDDGPAVFTLGEIVAATRDMARGRLAVVSPGGDEGSVVAWEVARRLAGSATVLLVDLTGSGVTSAEFTGSHTTRGLCDMLSGDILLRDAIHRDRMSPAYILPSGSGGGIASLARLTETASSLSRAFDYVVFDCGVTGSEGLSHVIEKTDTVLVSAEGAEIDDIETADAELRRAGYGETVVVAFDDEDRRIFEANAA